MGEDEAINIDALRMLGTMLRLLRSIQRSFREQVGVDLTLSDLHVLTQIEHGVDLPSTIAEALHLDRPRVSRIADRLVAHGYVDRSADESDRRRSRLSLTPEGARLLVHGRRAVSRATDMVLGDLSEHDRRRLMESLETVRPLLDNRRVRQEVS